MAAAAYFAVGFVWFSLLFEKTRNADLEKIGIKITPPASNQMAKMMALSFVGNLVGATAIAYVLHHFGVGGDVVRGLRVGLLMGVGYAASTLAISYLWEGKSLKLFMIDAGHYIVGLVVCSLILSLWR